MLLHKKEKLARELSVFITLAFAVVIELCTTAANLKKVNEVYTTISSYKDSNKLGHKKNKLMAQP